MIGLDCQSKELREKRKEERGKRVGIVDLFMFILCLDLWLLLYTAVVVIFYI